VRPPARHHRTPPFLTLGALGLVCVACGDPQTPRAPVLALHIPPIEAMPASRLATMAARDETLAAARLDGGTESPMRLRQRTRRWAAGATIKVAFRGGDAQLHRQIAEVAALWTVHANVGFDFGDGRRGFRTWSPNDTAYTAHVRIGFDEPGHFSCVGDESVNAACAAPGQASMNFERLDRGLPADWRGVVLHHFGHALGLEDGWGSADHLCDAGFRWEDEPDYVRTVDRAGQPTRDGAGRWPGIYSVLAAPPRAWNRPRVDAVLRRPPDARAPGQGTEDPASVMRVERAAWMFRDDSASRCFAPRAERLSATDEDEIAAMYPRAPAAVVAAVQRHAAALTSIRDAERLPPPIRRFVEARLAGLHAARVPAAPR
jgi:hypothetical protein